MVEEATTAPYGYGGLLDWKPTQAARWYKQNIAHHPLLQALMQGTAGYFLGRHVASPLWEAISPARSEEAEKRRRRALTAAGIGAGLIGPALTTAGRLHGGEGLGESLFRPFYKGSSEKQAAGYIPAFPGTHNIILADPILSPYEKAVAMSAVTNALEQSDKKGLFTTGDLVRGAIGAGLGYSGASVAGRLLGLAFGLGSKGQKRLRQTGLIGGILSNTGILRV